MSRFVAAGGDASAAPETSDDAWEKAREAIEATKKPKREVGKQEDGKSLYETLQANKAAKQAEFEESIRLKNQFRSLDDDEVDFLENVTQTERAKEHAVRKENEEQLEAFRRQQESQAQVQNTITGTKTTKEVAESDEWNTRKRRRKETENRALKIRRTSSNGDRPAVSDPTGENLSTSPPTTKVEGVNADGKSSSDDGQADLKPSLSAPGLGLAAYSSDED